MKTLIVSLLRVGDLFQHMKMVKMFAEQQELGEIHWLVDESSSPAQELLGSNVHIFPRSTIQNILVQRVAHPARAVRLVKELIINLNGENFDLVLNLTHTRVAHQILDQISAGRIRGGRSDISKNPEWKALNNIAGSDVNPPKTYAQLICEGLGFDWRLPLTHSEPIPRRGLAFHLISQDEKKNWTFENWARVLQQMRKRFPFETFYLLGSPQQADQLKLLGPSGVEIECSPFLETQKRLAGVRALIGIDSSLAHLAATVDTPSYLIYLGSANAKKIVPIQQKAAVLEATSVCYPCPHAKSCSQSSHKCGESIQVKDFIRFLEDKLLADQDLPAIGLGNIFAGL